MIRAAASALLLIGALLQAGCAMLGGAGASAPTPSGSPAAAPAAPTLAVEVVAPPGLKAVLERHLDLVRLVQASRGETVTDGELARLVDAAQAQVRELASTEGYFDARSQVQRVPAARPGEPETVRVLVEPGEPVRVGRLTLEVDGALAAEALAGQQVASQTLQAWRAAWRLRTGEVFRNADWSDAKGAAMSWLRSRGYAAASWAGTAVEVDPATKLARIFVVADSGPLFRRGPVVVEGLRLHDPKTVENLVAIPEGSPVTETLLLDAQDRLQKAGLFDRVTVLLDTDPVQADAARILVTVSETSLHQLTLGAGFSANTGGRVTAEHIYRRVLGYAATARNKVELAQARQAWDGELSTHADERLNRWVLGVTVERLSGSNDVVLSQRLKFGRAQDSPRIDRFNFGQFDRSSRRTDALRTDSRAYSLNSHWTWRDIDNPILPTDGQTWRLELGSGLSQEVGGRSDGFGRVYGRATFYRPLGAGWYGQARAEYGQVLVRRGLEVPESLRFRAGGDDSVRGYGYRSLGPLTNGVLGSGDTLLTASLEAARPLRADLPSLWGAVFVDAGQAASDLRSLSPAVGAGVGLRWRSPLGPLRLDVARGFEVRQWRLHFSVGIVF